MKDNHTHIELFNFIAPLYNLFFSYQVKRYMDILSSFNEIFYFPKENKVLDIGCGTGALLCCLSELGWDGTGIDPAENMLKQAKRSLQKCQGNLKLLKADITDGVPYPDDCFDLVISSYVLHGLQIEARVKVYTEARRLSQNLVVFIDYNQNRRLLTSLVEWFEGGDYFHFIKNPSGEMKEFFSTVTKIDISTQGAIYLCRI